MDTELTNGDAALSEIPKTTTKELKTSSQRMDDKSEEASSFLMKETESKGLQNGDHVSEKHREEEAHKYNKEILQNGDMMAKSDLLSEEHDKVLESKTGAIKKSKDKLKKESHESTINQHDPDSGDYMMASKSSSSTAYSHMSTTAGGSINDKPGLDLGKLGEIKLSTKVTSMDDLGASFLNNDEEDDDDGIDSFVDASKMSSALRTERFVESTLSPQVHTTIMGGGELGGPPPARRETDDLVKRILAESEEACAASDSSRVKVSMGGLLDDDDSRFSSGTERVIGAERKASMEQGQSLFERRLESLGIERELNDMMSSSKRRAGDTYDYYDSVGRKPYSNTSDYGSLDNDVESTRGRYSQYGRDDGLDGAYGSRGRFMRQRYVDDYDRFEGEEPEEELIPDEEFEPQRRPETNEVVKEKTDDIRGMVDRQNNVLQKLRRASESFDELSNEIRNIKQQFFENQARRSQMMDDIEYEVEMSRVPPEPAGRRRQGFGNYSDLDFEPLSGKRGGLSDNVLSRRHQLDDEDEPVLTSNLGLATANDDTCSVYSCGFKSERKSDAVYGRSRSLYDDYGIDNDDASSEYSLPRKSRYAFEQDDLSSDYSSTRKNRYAFEQDDAASDYSSSRKSRYDIDKKDEEDDDIFGATAPSASKYTPGSYTPGSYSASRLSGGYASKYGRFNRSKTLSDADTDTFGRSDYSSSSSSGFTSRFLSKVRQDRATGEAPSTTKRDKPFKSRFLRNSFESDFPTPSNTTFSTKYSSLKKAFGATEDDSRSDVSASTADTLVEVPPATSSSTADDSSLSSAAGAPSAEE